MKTTKIGLIILGTIAAVGFAMPAFAGPVQQPAQLQEKQAKPVKGNPFKGKVESVDTRANTMTVSGKLIYTSANTKFTKGGKEITLADIQTGDEVHGTTHQTAAGKAEADRVTVGAKEKKDTSQK